MITMFLLCFFVWAVVVDNAVLPTSDHLRQDVGTFTRYRVKKWDKGGKLDLLQDELLVYAAVRGREQFYYIEYKPYFENALKTLAPETAVQLRYANRFPKFWKRQLYEVRVGGAPVVRHSSAQIIQKQKEIWKFTGIMAGAFLVLAVLGLINKPRR
jgi:hypothetical protein